MRATVARRYGSSQPGEMAWVLSQSSSEGVVDLIVRRCRQAAAVSEPIGIPDSLESEETHGDWSGYSTRSRFAWRSPGIDRLVISLSGRTSSPHILLLPMSEKLPSIPGEVFRVLSPRQDQCRVGEHRLLFLPVVLPNDPDPVRPHGSDRAADGFRLGDGGVAGSSTAGGRGDDRSLRAAGHRFAQSRRFVCRRPVDGLDSFECLLRLGRWPQQALQGQASTPLVEEACAVAGHASFARGSSGRPGCDSTGGP